MIKRIIFDVDNTLLDTNKDCIDAYKYYFKDSNIKPINLYNLIDKYESNGGNYNHDDLEQYIRNNLDSNFNLNRMLSIYGNYGTLLNSNISNTLEYLSKKYELVILSNWYIDSQRNRLSKSGILKYFKDVYCFENAAMKPSKEAFIKACGDKGLDECLMVGDSIKSDVEVPYKMGMNVMYVGNSLDYPHINSVEELRNIL